MIIGNASQRARGTKVKYYGKFCIYIYVFDYPPISYFSEILFEQRSGTKVYNFLKCN